MNRAALFASFLLPTLAFAQAEKHPYDTAKEAFEKQLIARRAAAKANADLLVLDHVEADRAGKRVTIYAIATGVAESDPIEFFVSTLSSGKDYESLAITYATAADVDRALRFIGLAPGRRVDYEKNLQWPRGPRVTMTFVDGDARSRAELQIITTGTGAPLPLRGLVYVGSPPPAAADGETVTAGGGGPIAPLYNDPAAVLDVPTRSAQGAVYGTLRANPKNKLPLGRPLKVVVEPATGDAAVRSRDLIIRAGPPGGPGAYVLEEERKTLASVPNLPSLIAALGEQAKAGDDLFSTVVFDPRMPVSEARKLYALLSSIENDPGVKLGPPTTGLFHKAFFPEEGWRDRQARLGEPWELFLTREAGQLQGRLERQTEAADPAASQPVTLDRTSVADPDAFVRAINAVQSPWTKAVFVYPPADLTMGELDAWVVPALATYPRIFVFPALAPSTAPAP
ncbi:MAG TPA: YdjY domain-containing protein [Tepidisphaeraceae bacterium]|jgi:hypothetical protein